MHAREIGYSAFSRWLLAGVIGGLLLLGFGAEAAFFIEKTHGPGVLRAARQLPPRQDKIPIFRLGRGKPGQQAERHQQE